MLCAAAGGRKRREKQVSLSPQAPIQRNGRRLGEGVGKADPGATASYRKGREEMT